MKDEGCVTITISSEDTFRIGDTIVSDGKVYRIAAKRSSTVLVLCGAGVWEHIKYYFRLTLSKAKALKEKFYARITALFQTLAGRD